MERGRRKTLNMTKERVKEIFDIVSRLCSIVSCAVAVYGVFQVVDFVVEVKPIVVPIAKEVKDGNMDARTLFSGSNVVVRHDTVRVTERDTVYLEQNEVRHAEKAMAVGTSLHQSGLGKKLTAEEEQKLDKSGDKVSEQERKDIEDGEASFRQRMRSKMNR